ncbi:MAG TPA: trimethylamine methyltransferase family protein [Steroidobacteraceae bacterium]|nr:trimethylamine methyltransferase family protein [Steroidobacteraceae bacterium]
MTDLEMRAARRPNRRRSPTAENASPIAARSTAYRQLENPFEPLRVFSDDQVGALHDAALQILETHGMKVLSADALRRYRDSGAEVDEATQLVRIDRGLVARALATAPRSFLMHASDAARSVPMGGRHVAFAPTSGPPNIMDTAGGRRAGTLEDFSNLMKLCQHFDVIQVLGGAVEPQDVPVHLRHLEVMRAQLLLTDKIPFMFSRGHGQIADNFELIRIAHGLTTEQFRDRPSCYTVINTNSPLQLDIPMADGIVDTAAAGQVLIITPFTLAGAMAPVTIAGALTLAHAEALAGLTLAQMTRPGAPVIYGSFTSNVDMKSGSPAFGTPEYVKASFGAGQLARHLGLPWRSSNATASNTPDAQSAYEAQMSLWGALMGGCNFMLHAAGWLESGLSTSYEKFILDIEMLQMFAEVFQPVGGTAADIALEAVAEVGHGGHFFGCAHTMERYRTAFYAPLVSDWRNFGTWFNDGARTATERAHLIWKETLARYEAPARDPAVVEALNAYVERRSSEGGAPPVS